MESETIKVMNQDMVKLDRFDGNNFARWRDKMMFLLTALKISYILDPNLAPIEDPTPTFDGGQPSAEAIERVNKEKKKRAEDELLCRGHILNTLSDRLYDLFTEMKSAREIWNALEFKYKAEEQGTNKYLIAKYFDYKFIDTKPLLEQVHELQVIVNKIRALKIDIPEAFQVGAIIAKLPPSWKDYGKRLIHKSEDFTLEQIQKHLRIEEESRSRDNSVLYNSKVNFVDKKRKLGQNFKVKSGGHKFKRTQKKQKGCCFVCGKQGHYAKDCFQRKSYSKDKNNQVVKADANLVEENYVAMISNMFSNMEISEINDAMAMVSEINSTTVQSSWWIDSGATVHVCKDKYMFKQFEEIVDSSVQEVLMANNALAKVAGKGTVEIDFTSGKKITLLNVLFIPEIRKNLVSIDLLCKRGFRVLFESDKVILSKNGLFVGKGYANDGMYQLRDRKSVV